MADNNCRGAMGKGPGLGNGLPLQPRRQVSPVETVAGPGRINDRRTLLRRNDCLALCGENQRVLGPVLDHDFAGPVQAIACRRLLGCAVAKDRLFIIMGRQHESRHLGRIGQGAFEFIGLGPEHRTDIRIERGLRAVGPGRANGVQQPRPRIGGQNGQGNAGEINQVRRLGDRAQRIRIISQQFCRRCVAPIGEVPVTIGLMDHIKPGTLVADLADGAGADLVTLEKIQHLARIDVVADGCEIIDRPAAGQGGAGIPGGIQRVAGIALFIGLVLAARHFDHAFADTYKTLQRQSPNFAGGPPLEW